MKVIDVLNKKGHGYYRVSPNESVPTLLKLFLDHRIGSLVVVDTEDVGIGLVTERTVIETLAKKGAAAFDAAAQTLMISPAPTCKPDHDIRFAMSMMTELRTRHLVVADTARIYGIISLGDLVKSRLQDAELEILVLRDMAGAGQLALSRERPVYPSGSR